MFLRILVGILLFGVVEKGFCQTKDSIYYQRPMAIVSYMKPIRIENGRYYYGPQRLSNANSLEIPFFELNDEYVNTQFKMFKNFQTASRLISLLPTFYFIYSLSSRTYNQNVYWGVFGGTLVGSLAFDAVGRSHARKAIEGYNIRVMNNKMGFSVQPLPNQALVYSFGYVWDF